MGIFGNTIEPFNDPQITGLQAGELDRRFAGARGAAQGDIFSARRNIDSAFQGAQGLAGSAFEGARNLIQSDIDNQLSGIKGEFSRGRDELSSLLRSGRSDVLSDFSSQQEGSRALALSNIPANLRQSGVGQSALTRSDAQSQAGQAGALRALNQQDLQARQGLLNRELGATTSAFGQQAQNLANLASQQAGIISGLGGQQAQSQTGLESQALSSLLGLSQGQIQAFQNDINSLRAAEAGIAGAQTASTTAANTGGLFGHGGFLGLGI